MNGTLQWLQKLSIPITAALIIGAFVAGKSFVVTANDTAKAAVDMAKEAKQCAEQNKQEISELKQATEKIDDKIDEQTDKINNLDKKVDKTTVYLELLLKNEGLKPTTNGGN